MRKNNPEISVWIKRGCLIQKREYLPDEDPESIKSLKVKYELQIKSAGREK